MPGLLMKNLSVTIKLYTPLCMKNCTFCKAMFIPQLSLWRHFAGILPLCRAVCRSTLLLLAILSGLSALPAHAQSRNNPSGLPLPRFATTKSDPINVRVGPGTRYDISWIFVKSGQPVEIIQEFDTWRKIRDIEGEEGWVHQNLLSGRRAGLVTPWAKSGQIALRERQSIDANVRAWLSPGFLVELRKCQQDWCAVRASVTPKEGRTKTYSGFVPQSDLWGVYPGEEFD